MFIKWGIKMSEETSIKLVDLSNINNTSDLISSLSKILLENKLGNKNFSLNLGSIDLNYSQLNSLILLINAENASLVNISTDSNITYNSAIELNLLVTRINENVKEDTEENINVESENQFITIENPHKTNAPEENSFDGDLIQDKNQEGDKKEAEIKLASILQEQDLDNTEIEKNNNSLSKEDIEILKAPTLYIKQTLRSGQCLNYDGNILIIGDCKPGSEITAKYDITVFGKLSGIAHAGCKGNKRAKVRALELNPIQLRIADCYSRRPDCPNIIPNEKKTNNQAEEAKIVNNQIKIYKII